MELAAIHTVSLPFIGGGAAFVEFPHPMGYEALWGDLVMDGAKGIPAVFAAQYVVNTALKGLHAPSIKFKEVLTTAARYCQKFVCGHPLLRYCGPLVKIDENPVIPLLRYCGLTTALLRSASDAVMHYSTTPLLHYCGYSGRFFSRF